MIPQVIVILLCFILLVRVGTDPSSSAVCPVADNTLQPARVLTDLLEIVTEPTQVTQVALDFGCDVGTDNVALEYPLLPVLLLERRSASLPVHVEHLARLEFLAEAGLEELVAFFIELVLHEVKVNCQLLFLQFVD